MGKEKKWKGNSKINNQINNSLYNWIVRHPQVVQSPIFNDCLKVKIDGHTRPQFFQNCYCRCPPENFITDLLVTHTILESKMQEIQRIISLSVILHYIHYCHLNLKKCHHDTTKSMHS